MEENLYQLAQKYISTIEEIEAITDSNKLQKLEEKRVDLHWKFMEALKKQGIEFKDRDHATRIAMKIARQEL